MSKHKKIPLIISALVLVLTSFYSMAVWAVSTPAQSSPTDLGQLIQQIFTWSLALLGIAVFVMFFYAGFLWLTAAGNTANVDEARKRMTNAVLGAILLLSSYLILNTINPDFVKNTVNLPGLGTTKPGGGGGGEWQNCEDVPTAQACAATDQTDLVRRVKDFVVAQGLWSGDGSTGDFCGEFEVIRRVACAAGAGLLVTFHSAQCNGIAARIIAYPDNSGVKILNDQGPRWDPGPAGPESGVYYTPATGCPIDSPGSY